MSAITAQQALAMLTAQGNVQPKKSMTEKVAEWTTTVGDDWDVAKQRALKAKKLRWVELVLKEQLTPPEDVREDVVKMLELMSK
jgi:hypothetical protein